MKIYSTHISIFNNVYNRTFRTYAKYVMDLSEGSTTVLMEVSHASFDK